MAEEIPMQEQEQSIEDAVGAAIDKMERASWKLWSWIQ